MSMLWSCFDCSKLGLVVPGLIVKIAEEFSEIRVCSIDLFEEAIQLVD